MKAMKSQAIAFGLGFTLTSFVLFYSSGVAKKTAHVAHPNTQNMAVMVHDSTAAINGQSNATSSIGTP
jgi:hypothetical protein